jgi:hypothetical protein
MNYRLIINIFSKEMQGQPVPIAVGIPEELARFLMNLTVRSVKLTIDQDIAPTSIPLLDFNTLGGKPDANRPELKRLFDKKPKAPENLREKGGA